MSTASTLPFSSGELMLFMQAPLASWVLAASSGAVLGANTAATHFVPRTAAAAGQPVLFQHHFGISDEERIDRLLQGGGLGANGSLGVLSMLRVEGGAQLVELFAAPLYHPQLQGWILSAVPVTTTAEDAIFRNLVMESSAGTVLCDGFGTITLMTPVVADILGWEASEVVGQNVFSFVHPEDLAWASRAFSLEKEGNPELKSIVIRLKHKKDSWTWCMVRGNNLLNHPGVEQFAIYFHDDSQRKLASDALKASEEKFRNLVHSLQVGVMLLHNDGTIQIANDLLCRMLRKRVEEMSGRLFWEVNPYVVDESGKRLRKEDRPIYQSLQLNKPVKNRLNGFWIDERQEYIWLLITAEPVCDADGKMQYMLCSFTDVTEHRRLTERLVEAKVHRQRLLTQATVEGQEKERREIGKELHDNIGQQLATIKLYLEMANIAPGIDGARVHLKQAIRQVSGAINEVRQISRTLVPHSLQDLGLVDSITELCNAVAQTGKLVISFEHDHFKEGLLHEKEKLALFRMVQEQLTNILRHAGASSASIHLVHQQGSVLLLVEDDGVGFDPSQVKKGLGFSNIQSRAELFGGTVQLHAAPGQGCTLEVLLPQTISDRTLS